MKIGKHSRNTITERVTAMNSEWTCGFCAQKIPGHSTEEAYEAGRVAAQINDTSLLEMLRETNVLLTRELHSLQHQVDSAAKQSKAMDAALETLGMVLDTG